MAEFTVTNHLVRFDGDGFGEERVGMVLAELDEGLRFMVMGADGALGIVHIADCYFFEPRINHEWASFFKFLRRHA